MDYAETSPLTYSIILVLPYDYYFPFLLSYYYIIMFKAIAYLTLGLLVFFSLTFLALYVPYMFEEQAPVDVYYDGGHLITPQKDTRKLQYLNDLVSMPLIGRFFL